jgi:accessory gene regulator protein AgrB
VQRISAKFITTRHHYIYRVCRHVLFSYIHIYTANKSNLHVVMYISNARYNTYIQLIMAILGHYEMWFYIPDDGILHSHHRDKLKFYSVCMLHAVVKS